MRSIRIFEIFSGDPIMNHYRGSWYSGTKVLYYEVTYVCGVHIIMTLHCSPLILTCYVGHGPLICPVHSCQKDCSLQLKCLTVYTIITTILSTMILAVSNIRAVPIQEFCSIRYLIYLWSNPADTDHWSKFTLQALRVTTNSTKAGLEVSHK